ncbi:hypothetical protein BDZ89DRAFT_216445 [Hymenopellis radicata]|nr:hypothetical protein BDZ89DRAFT_216445 [Hymenopellis radicata]
MLAGSSSTWYVCVRRYYLLLSTSGLLNDLGVVQTGPMLRVQRTMDSKLDMRKGCLHGRDMSEYSPATTVKAKEPRSSGQQLRGGGLSAHRDCLPLSFLSPLISCPWVRRRHRAMSRSVRVRWFIASSRLLAAPIMRYIAVIIVALVTLDFGSSSYPWLSFRMMLRDRMDSCTTAPFPMK